MTAISRDSKSYFIHRQKGTPLVGITLKRIDMVNESALELPGKYFFFMGYKSIDALVFQLTNHTGAQVNYLLVFIGELLVLDTLQNVLLRGLIEEVEEQPRHGLKCQDFQLMGIFQVHDLIANIVSSLHKIDQRMAGIAER